MVAGTLYSMRKPTDMCPGWESTATTVVDVCMFGLFLVST